MWDEHREPNDGIKKIDYENRLCSCYFAARSKLIRMTLYFALTGDINWGIGSPMIRTNNFCSEWVKYTIDNNFIKYFIEFCEKCIFRDHFVLSWDWTRELKYNEIEQKSRSQIIDQNTLEMTSYFFRWKNRDIKTTL